jgi:hypothetical protein
MIKTSLITAALVMATSGLAHAGGQEGTIGVGAEFMLSGIGGASVNYDAGAFHLGGFLGFADGRFMAPDEFVVGGRFYYHVHSTAMSDFGIGGGLGVDSIDPDGDGPADRDTAVFLEPSLQIRLFLAANVALSFTAGVSIGLQQADGVAISGQGTDFNAGGGVHYYFF